MKKFSSVFSCFHTDIMNKYIFPVQQKISGKFPENFLEIFRNIFFRKSYITSIRVSLVIRDMLHKLHLQYIAGVLESRDWRLS